VGGDPGRGAPRVSAAWIYFSSFVLLGVFVVVNLFIAVVINNLEAVKHEQQLDSDRTSTHGGLLEAIDAVRSGSRSSRTGFVLHHRAAPSTRRPERISETCSIPNQRFVPEVPA
jgi:hypothetical protein